VPDNAPEVRLVRDWLDSWSGVGLVIAGMAYQGWDVQLTEYGDGHWRATFYVTGMALFHRRRLGAGAEAPGGRVQRAAWSEQDGGEVLGTGRKFTNGEAVAAGTSLADSWTQGRPLRREGSAAHPGDRRL
jgi:hypothetical protein